jgi:hypothetical protein
MFDTLAVPVKVSSWAPHYNLIQELEKRTSLHPENIAYTIRIEIGPNGGLRAIKVMPEEDHKRRQ